MNRIIKFRALYDDGQTRKFVYGYLIYDTNGVPQITDIYDSGTLTMYAECEKGTEGQFTGLTDKNGSGIYEGDIIEIKHPFKNRNYIGVVEFDGYSFGCKSFFFSHFDNPNDVFSEGTTYISVVGNIHENPELLNNQ